MDLLKAARSSEAANKRTERFGVPPQRNSTIDFSTESPDTVTQANGEARFLVARKQTLDSIRASASENEIQVIRTEVESALSKLRAHISPQRFQEALEHGIEKRLLDRRGFPDYDRWIRDQGNR